MAPSASCHEISDGHATTPTAASCNYLSGASASAGRPPQHIFLIVLMMLLSEHGRLKCDFALERHCGEIVARILVVLKCWAIAHLPSALSIGRKRGRFEDFVLKFLNNERLKLHEICGTYAHCRRQFSAEMLLKRRKLLIVNSANRATSCHVIFTMHTWRNIGVISRLYRSRLIINHMTKRCSAELMPDILRRHAHRAYLWPIKAISCITCRNCRYMMEFAATYFGREWRILRLDVVGIGPSHSIKSSKSVDATVMKCYHEIVDGKSWGRLCLRQFHFE